MPFPLALIPAIAGLAQTGYGAIKAGQAQADMKRERTKWSAENEALYNKDYYGDYTKRADVQNIVGKMRDEMKKQGQVDNNVAAVTGATPEAINASKERRNKAMSNLYGNLAERGQMVKDRAKESYLARKHSLQGLEYDIMGQQAQSANNLIQNGLSSLASSDWSNIVGKNVQRNDINLGKLPTPPVKGLPTPKGPVIPKTLPGFRDDKILY